MNLGKVIIKLSCAVMFSLYRVDPNRQAMAALYTDAGGHPFTTETPLGIAEKNGLPPTSSEISQHAVEWTEEEEKQLVRRIDRLVMPLLMLAFFSLQLDRGNM